MFALIPYTTNVRILNVDTPTDMIDIRLKLTNELVGSFFAHELTTMRGIMDEITLALSTGDFSELDLCNIPAETLETLHMFHRNGPDCLYL